MKNVVEVCARMESVDPFGNGKHLECSRGKSISEMVKEGLVELRFPMPGLVNEERFAECWVSACYSVGPVYQSRGEWRYEHEGLTFSFMSKENTVSSRWKRICTVAVLDLYGRDMTGPMQEKLWTFYRGSDIQSVTEAQYQYWRGVVRFLMDH